MSPFKICEFYFIIFNILAVAQCLVELPTAEDNNIAATEVIIRNTVNDLFTSLRLKDVKHKPRLKQFLTIYNFFASLTLRDHDNLNEIVRLTRGKQPDNTSIVTEPLNELLNEDNTDEANYDTVTLHVEKFLSKLKYLKEKYDVSNLSRNTNVNKDILRILEDKNDYNFVNNEIGVNNEPNILDSNEYWKENGRRIYRGTNTKSKYFPFMASIQFFSKFQCAGSIIKSDLVITAASCLQLAYNNRFFRENPAFLTVSVGSTFYEGGGENIPILEIYFHPMYNPRNLVNNLALMRLLRRLNFKDSKKIKKIDFDRNESPLPENTDGITIVGWGAKGSSNILNDPWANRLSFAVIDFYPLRECREIYSKEYVTRTNFCAGFFSKGGGACNRDVGGPGVVSGLLTGVVSFGSPVCGAPDAPTVFTKLGYYTDWIEEIMEQEVPGTLRGTTLKPNRTRPTTPPSHATRLSTFKVEPLTGGRLRPRPAEPTAEPAAALRIYQESDFFTKFLATMFNSKEMEEYSDLIDTIRQKAEEKQTTEPSEEVTEASTTTTTEATTIQQLMEPVTKLEVYDESQETTTKRYKTYTVMDKNLVASVEDEFENDIVRFFDDVNVSKLTSEPVTKEPENLDTPIEKTHSDSSQDNDDPVNDIVKLLDNKDLMKLLDDAKDSGPTNNSYNSSKTADDSVLTLLYLTDNEKKTQEAEYDSDEGMSIPMQSFRDMTFRQNVTSDDYINLMSKNNLLDLLSEAIDLEIKESDKSDG